MALTNRQTASSYGASSVNLDITDGSGNNRILVAFAIQSRTPPNISAMTYNAVAPTGVIHDYDSGTVELMVAYWLDGALPGTGGTYSLAIDGTATNIMLAGICWSGAKQAAPTDQQYVDGTTQSNTSFTLTAPAGSEGLMAIRCGGGVVPVLGSGQTDIYAVANNRGASYDAADLLVSYTHTSAAVQAAAMAVEPFSGTTSTPYITLLPQLAYRRANR